MLLPSVSTLNSFPYNFFKESLFDDGWMRFPFGNEWFGKDDPMGNKNMMKTDIQEKEDSYEVMVELPGFEKEEITARLEDGYLTISASREMKQEENGEDGKFLRKERYAGTMSRSFYVGDVLTQEDIRAKYENGVLQLTVPKKEVQREEKNSYIAIE